MKPVITQEVRNRLIDSARYVNSMDGTAELNRLNRQKHLLSRYANPLEMIPISSNFSGGSCEKCKCSQVYKKQYPRVTGGRFNMEM
jgi:hypothetical protein